MYIEKAWLDFGFTKIKRKKNNSNILDYEMKQPCNEMKQLSNIKVCNKKDLYCADLQQYFLSRNSDIPKNCNQEIFAKIMCNPGTLPHLRRLCNRSFMGSTR